MPPGSGRLRPMQPCSREPGAEDGPGFSRWSYTACAGSAMIASGTMVEQTAPVQEKRKGLSQDEVADRRARGETNAVSFQTSRSYRRILLENAFTPVNTTL